MKDFSALIERIKGQESTSRQLLQEAVEAIEILQAERDAQAAHPPPVDQIDIPTATGICSACDDVHGWSVAIEAAIDLEFPSSEVRDRWHDGLRADHPMWARRAELYALHNQAVADFSYDDSDVKLCAKHLRELAVIVGKHGDDNQS